MRVALSPITYGPVDKQNAFYRALLDRVRAIPGLSSAGAVDGLPFSTGGFDNSFSIDGRPDPPAGQPLKADIRRMDPGYFPAMRIALIQGRSFRDTDRTDAPPVIVISQSMARKYWPNEGAIGKRLTIHFGPPEGIQAEIVGVAADVRPALDANPGDYIYMHYPQGRHVGEMDLVLRPSQAGNSSALVAAVRAAVASLDPDQPVYRIRTMDEMLRVSLSTRRFEMLLLGVFAAFAACLAAIGLYGVLAYSVQARTREIGIRTALGAGNAQVLIMVLGEALKLTAIGLSAGVLGAVALTRLLSTLLFGVQPTDPATFAAVSVLLLVVAVAAGYIPARRAAGIDPLVALRHE
jgi:putative ABC transport system permease protein